MKFKSVYKIQKRHWKLLAPKLRSVNVFFALGLNKQLSCQLSETSLTRYHCIVMGHTYLFCQHTYEKVILHVGAADDINSTKLGNASNNLRWLSGVLTFIATPGVSVSIAIMDIIGMFCWAFNPNENPLGVFMVTQSMYLYIIWDRKIKSSKVCPKYMVLCI